MRGIKLAARAAGFAVTAVLALLLVGNLYLIAAGAITGEHPTLFGYAAAVVVSGSMSPTIEVDDMVIIHRQDSYSRRDIITYKDGEILVTHRIEDITDGGYITKGDANNTTDGTISPDRVVGRVILVIPKVGALIAFLRTPFGMLLLVLGGLVVLEWRRIEEFFRRDA